MRYKGRVEDGKIIVQVGNDLADGKEVEVNVFEVIPPTDLPETDDQTAPPNSLSALFMEFAGVIDDLPSDFAAEHDHYIHGTPKRGNRDLR